MPHEASSSRPDLRHEVIAVLLEPALTLACVAGVTLPDLVSLVRGTYVRVGRARGHSVRSMARRYGVAPGTIQAIANQLKAHGTLGGLGEKIAHRRAVVAQLTERGELRARDLATSTPGCRPAQVEEALARLVADKMVARERGRVRLLRHHLSIARSDDAADRVDRLRQLLEATTQVVYRRFFAPEGPGIGYARAFTFGVSRRELEALREETSIRLGQHVRRLGEAATPGDPDHTIGSIALVVVETPNDGPLRGLGRV